MVEQDLNIKHSSKHFAAVDDDMLASDLMSTEVGRSEISHERASVPTYFKAVKSLNFIAIL
jgi:hypothetical protein